MPSSIRSASNPSSANMASISWRLPASSRRHRLAVRRSNRKRGSADMAHRLEHDLLWPRVNKAAPNECWEWQGARNRHGYGTLTVRRRKWLAHRLSWNLANGVEAPPNRVVCHRCDNPACVNPRHLWLGTQADNMRDMFGKGRGKYVVPRNNVGARNPMSKLSDDQVREIRSLAGSASQRQIGHRFGVGQDQISRIISGKRRADA